MWGLQSRREGTLPSVLQGEWKKKERCYTVCPCHTHDCVLDTHPHTLTHPPIILNFMSCFVNSSNAFHSPACNYSSRGEGGERGGGRGREEEREETQQELGFHTKIQCLQQGSSDHIICRARSQPPPIDPVAWCVGFLGVFLVITWGYFTDCLAYWTVKAHNCSALTGFWAFVLNHEKTDMNPKGQESERNERNTGFFP